MYMFDLKNLVIRIVFFLCIRLYLKIFCLEGFLDLRGREGNFFYIF